MGKKYPCPLISRVLFPSPPEFRERRRKKVFFMDVCHTRRHLCYPRPRSFRKQHTNVLDMLHAPPPTFVGTTCGFPSAPENVKGGGEEEATHAAFVSPHNFHLYTPRLFMPGLIRENRGERWMKWLNYTHRRFPAQFSFSSRIERRPDSTLCLPHR